MANSSQFTIRLAVNSGGVTAGINSAIGQFQRLAAGIGRFQSLLVGGLVANYVRELINWGGSVNDAAGRAGIAVEEFQAFTEAAKENGVEMGDLENAYKKFQLAQIAAIKGNKELRQSFARAGLSVEDLRNLTAQNAFMIAGANFEKLPIAAQTTADAVALMGKSGDKMLNAFRNGFIQSALAAREFGLVVDQDTIQKLDDLGDAMDRIKTKIRVNLAEPITDGISQLEIFSETLQSTILWIDSYIRAKGSSGKTADALKAANDAVDEYFKASTVGSGPNPRKKAMPKTPDETGVEEDEKLRKGKSNAINPNALQQIGARVSVSPALIIPQKQLVESQKQTAILSKIEAKIDKNALGQKTLNPYLDLIGGRYE